MTYQRGTTPYRYSWSEYAMKLAEAAALRSEDPHRQVGTCLLRPDNTVAGLGYNGAPAGVELDWEDRDARRAWVLHAESNALRYARPGEVEVLVTTAIPCSTCLLLIASYGIGHVVYRDELDWEVYDRDQIFAIAEKTHITMEQLLW